MSGLDHGRDRGRFHGGAGASVCWMKDTAARALLRDPAITVEEVARRLRVGAATLYRYLPGGRGALVGNDKVM